LKRKLEEKNVGGYEILAAVNIKKFKLNNRCVHPFKNWGFSCRGRMNSCHMPANFLLHLGHWDIIFLIPYLTKDVSAETVKTKEGEKWDKFTRVFRLPLRSRWELRYSGLTRFYVVPNKSAILQTRIVYL
jgi:hypothetical protein